MNSKKAKRLRALVKHLQTNGTITANPNWVTYNEDGTKQRFTAQYGIITIPTSRTLDDSCGRAIYQKMKKNARMGRPR